jgi:hypothetical protein
MKYTIAILLAGIIAIGIHANAQPDGVDIPSEPEEQFEAGLLEERIIELLRSDNGNRLTPEIRRIVRDEIAKQTAKAKP